MFPPFSFVAICHELAMVGNTEVKLASSFLSSKRRATLGQTHNDTRYNLFADFLFTKKSYFRVRKGCTHKLPILQPLVNLFYDVTNTFLGWPLKIEVKWSDVLVKIPYSCFEWNHLFFLKLPNFGDCLRQWIFLQQRQLKQSFLMCSQKKYYLQFCMKMHVSAVDV